MSSFLLLAHSHYGLNNMVRLSQAQLVLGIVCILISISEAEVCPDKIEVKGAEAVQERRMGIFDKTTEMGNDNAGRPVYANANGEYLFYWASTSEWYIGSDYTSSRVGVKSIGGSGSACPTASMSWQVWTNAGWSSAYTLLVREACPNKIEVKGAETIQASRMGIFGKTSYMSNDNARRPIYTNANDEYLFYWVSAKDWFIGPDYTSSTAGIRTIGDSGSACPTASMSWQVFANGDWSSAYALLVREACPEKIEVKGAETVQSSRMGIFDKTTDTRNDNAGRPVYANTNCQYLFYLASAKDWYIGPDYTASTASIRSTGTSESACPTASMSWQVSANGGWSSAYALLVREACPEKIEVKGAEVFFL